MSDKNYRPEEYWDTVARRIGSRGGDASFVAGDNDPFYIYKRKKFLKRLRSVHFTGKKVLEVGCGPGGNLVEVYHLQALSVSGVDISSAMLDICKKNIEGMNITLKKTEGDKLPFDSGSFDITFSSTVLQHITDDSSVKTLIEEMKRVTVSDIYLFERVEKKRRKSRYSNIGRTLSDYSIFLSDNSFEMEIPRFLNVYWSRVACGIVRRVFNPARRKEGEPQTKLSVLLQKILLPFTSLLDTLIPVQSDVVMLHFRRKKSDRIYL